MVNYQAQQVTLPETNSSHLKMDGWNTCFLLGRPIFRCELLVSGSVAELMQLIALQYETMFPKLVDTGIGEDRGSHENALVLPGPVRHPKSRNDKVLQRYSSLYIIFTGSMLIL